jgi:hypothetical protein
LGETLKSPIEQFEMPVERGPFDKLRAGSSTPAAKSAKIRDSYGAAKAAPLRKADRREKVVLALSRKIPGAKA